MIASANAVGEAWWGWMAAMFWQVGVLIAIVGAVDLLIRRWAWPQVRYGLWLLVLAKLVIPPSVTLPTSLISPVVPWARQQVLGVEDSRDLSANEMWVGDERIALVEEAQWEVRGSRDAEDRFLATVWATTEVLFDYTLIEELLDNMRRIEGRDEAGLMELAKIRGPQLLFEHKTPHFLRPNRVISEVVEIAPKKPPAGVYSPPEGYARKERLGEGDF